MRERKGQLIAILTFVALLSTATIWLGGCKKKTQPSAQQTGQEEMISKSAEAIEQTTCPVMAGNKINKNIFVEYKGKKVYFCCLDCKGKFEQDPEKYISKLPQFQEP
jgi:YHS domain-containing protein